MQPQQTCDDFPGVAVLAHDKPCAQFLVWDTLDCRRTECNARRNSGTPQIRSTICRAKPWFALGHGGFLGNLLVVLVLVVVLVLEKAVLACTGFTNKSVFADTESLDPSKTFVRRPPIEDEDDDEYEDELNPPDIRLSPGWFTGPATCRTGCSARLPNTRN